MLEFVFSQSGEDITVFPDTKKSFIISINEILLIEKKHARGKYLQELGYGKLIITLKDAVYKLLIDNLDYIFSQLETNLKIRDS